MSYLLEDFHVPTGIVAYGSFSPNLLAQTFTAHRTYQCVRLSLKIGERDPIKPVVGGIYDVSGGRPNNELRDFTFNTPLGVGNSQVVNFPLSSFLTLTSGIEYAIVLEGIALPDVVFWNADTTIGGSYPDGVGMQRFNGDWLNNNFDRDFYFATYSEFGLDPSPSNVAEDVTVNPVLSWTIL
jgi:hypothetical protein